MALPEEVKELVLGMLQYEPDLRSTMKQVLQHPWLASTASVKDVAMQDVARSAAQVGSGLLTSCLGTALSRACLAAPPPQRANVHPLVHPSVYSGPRVSRVALKNSV